MAISETTHTNQFSAFVDLFPHMEEMLQCGVYVFDSNSQTENWSDGVYNILGIPPGSVKSNLENLLAFISKEDQDKVKSAVLRSRDTGEAYELEFSILVPDGTQKRVRAQNIFTSAPQKLRYGGIIRDITLQYKFEQALKEKVQQLDKSNQNLQEFVYIASHDLQEPLRKISTFAGRLNSKYKTELGVEGENYLGRILNSTSNMQKLLEDLLNFSRLSFTDRNFHLVDLNKVLEECKKELEEKIEESAAIITADPLPAIEGYGTQLQQLFSNLLSNALKFRRTDVVPKIQITATIQKDETSALPGQVCITFSDNGIGFEPEYSEKIFQIFQRLNGKAEFGGSGVGLSICRRIAENHDGRITATGEPGKGATFTVLLPLKQT